MTALLVAITGLLELIPASKASVDRWVRAGTFPRPIYIGKRRAWRVAEVEGWIETQAANRPPPAPARATAASRGQP